VLLLVAATHRELCGHDGLVCGVGPVEAAGATARALALRSFDAILHIGLAGGRELEPGTVVVGSEALYCDLAAEWPVIERARPDRRLVDSIARALPSVAELTIGTSAAVGGPCTSLSHSPPVEAMEGFGVLRAAEHAGVPAVEVRVISNEIGEPDRAKWAIPAALETLATTMPTLLAAVESVTARGS
jgi:futalosine hydrolase